MKVKEMNLQERPREKAVLEGMETLSNRELIAILLRSGTKEKSVLELADEVLHSKKSLVSLMELHIEDLMSIKGIKEAKATQLLACFELSRRIALDRMKQELQEGMSSEAIIEWLMSHIGHEAQEHFVVLFLNHRGSMIAHKDMFIGTGSKSFANPREIFMEALRCGSSKLICAHNHPSGIVKPSDADRDSADAIEQCGELLGVKVIDHLIISNHSYYSFREHYEMRDQLIGIQEEILKKLAPTKEEQQFFFPE